MGQKQWLRAILTIAALTAVFALFKSRRDRVTYDRLWSTQSRMLALICAIDNDPHGTGGSAVARTMPELIEHLKPFSLCLFNGITAQDVESGLDAWGNPLRYDTWRDPDGTTHYVIRSAGRDQVFEREEPSGYPSGREKLLFCFREGSDLVVRDGEFQRVPDIGCMEVCK